MLCGREREKQHLIQVPCHLGDTQEWSKAVVDMQMPPSHASKCSCFYTPPKDRLEATSTDLYALTPCHTFPTAIRTDCDY